MTINGVLIDRDKLLTKDELLDYLRENDGDDKALSQIREDYYEKFDNDLIWRYPISDGLHLGACIVVVREGFLNLPYDDVDDHYGELYELDDAKLHDGDSLQIFLDDFKLFADDLISALTGMIAIMAQN